MLIKVRNSSTVSLIYCCLSKRIDRFFYKMVTLEDQLIRVLITGNSEHAWHVRDVTRVLYCDLIDHMI